MRWNGAGVSCDCPCHGSCFSLNGKVLTAPSIRRFDQGQGERYLI
ncbi:MAG: hypothetical protein E2590_03790 [Chryseobacterium sp.]|nr:hypothetical protein [Chryseobacterium sp.]